MTPRIQTARGLRLQDVAERAGVSIATVSRSLAGASGVSDSVAERVREVARDMGYVGNVHARTLAGGDSRTVGLVVHEIGDPYFAEIASGVLQLGAERGLTVQICHSGRDPRREADRIRHLIADRVGAVLVAGSGFEPTDMQSEARAALAEYTSTGGRVAVIGRHHLGADAVLPENVAGGRAITRHLLELGHRHLAVATGARFLTTVVDRLAGVAQALEEAGMSMDEVPVVEAAFTRDGGRTATEQILDLHPRTTAILALNDDMALGALSALRSHGVAVPSQMSVAGFDDVAVAAYLSPALTTVHLPMVQMGEQVLEMALKAPASRPRRRRARASLVVRDSTARPRR